MENVENPTKKVSPIFVTKSIDIKCENIVYEVFDFKFSDIVGVGFCIYIYKFGIIQNTDNGCTKESITDKYGRRCVLVYIFNIGIELFYIARTSVGSRCVYFRVGHLWSI